MPKVGKHIYRSKARTVSMEVDVNFGTPSKYRIRQQDKFFWIRLNPEASGFNNGTDFVSGATNMEVIKKFDDVMDKVYSKKSKKQKVIGYKFESDVSQLDDYDKLVFNKQEMSFSLVVGTMTTMGDKKFFSTEKDTRLHPVMQNRHSPYADHVFINHTDEAEAWFTKTWTSFQKLIEGCDKFFSQSAPKLVQSMKSSSPLSLNNK